MKVVCKTYWINWIAWIADISKVLYVPLLSPFDPTALFADFLYGWPRAVILLTALPTGCINLEFVDQVDVVRVCMYVMDFRVCRRGVDQHGGAVAIWVEYDSLWVTIFQGILWHCPHLHMCPSSRIRTCISDHQVMFNNSMEWFPI